MLPFYRAASLYECVVHHDMEAWKLRSFYEGTAHADPLHTNSLAPICHIDTDALVQVHYTAAPASF